MRDWMMEHLIKEFENPSAIYRGKPFWSWNGKLEKEELMRQIDVLKDMGMGGYFCHSRTGLATEYLGEEWFDLINACADKGEECGMETWLYDEDRWPSGSAGGKVTESHEHRRKFLRMYLVSADEFAWDDEMIAAFAVHLDGLSFTGKKRLYQGDAPGRDTVLFFKIEEMLPSSVYNGNTYIDTLSRPAVEAFIELTHEKYKEKCGDKFGKSIKGIFTDEPERGSVMCNFGTYNGDTVVPYTPKLFAEFETRFGYDLTDYLPDVFLYPDGEKIVPVKWQLLELFQELFLENYMQPIQEWCQKNNMIFTGHLLHEDNLSCQVWPQGSLMRTYEYMDIPGMDLLMEENYCFWAAKQLQSAARQLGKKWMMSELYGATGWKMTFENYKSVGDWQALFGINLRCHHLSWYTMKGEAKRDYPASIFYQSAWYKEFSKLEDYFSRIHVMLTEGDPVCDVLVVNPVESLWANIHMGWFNDWKHDNPDIDEVEQKYAQLFHQLCGAKYDFDYGDEDYLKRLGKIETETDGSPVFVVGEGRYHTVVVGKMLTIRKTTLDLLRKFAEMGGEVIFAGDPPAYVDALRSDEAASLPAQYVPFEKAAESIQARPFITVKDQNGNIIPEIFVQTKVEDGKHIAFLLNVNRRQKFENAVISIGRGGYCEHWDCRTGARTLLTQGDAIDFTYTFEPSGELMLVLTDEDHHLPQEKPLALTGEAAYLEGPFSYQLSEPNVCVLDFADLRIDGGETQKHLEILKADWAVRDHFGLPRRGGDMLQPWFTGKLEHPVLGTVELDFSFFAEELPEKLMLAVETPEEFEILVNDKANALTAAGVYWVDPCFKTFLLDRDALKIGENTITLKCRFRQDVELESLYLLGDFGVRLDGAKRTLVRLPERLHVGSVTEQGLPFYGADICYELPVEKSERNFLLGTDHFDAACIDVADGDCKQMIMAQPYAVNVSAGDERTLKLHYVLTRKNTFGPLHLTLPVNGGGPETFVTTGDDFLEDGYTLVPQGMTEKVWIKK